MSERTEASVATWGDGPRRVLLLHGLSSNAQSWWRLGPDLAARGFTVVAPNLRGHGGSGLGDGLHLDGYRDDILAAGTGWDMALGHSLGGLVALACQLADPGFCSALVLEDPALALAPTPEVVDWLVADYAQPISAEALATARPRWSDGDIAAKVQALRAAGPHVVTGTMEALGGVDIWSELASVSVPTLLLGADPAQDALVSAEQGTAAEALGHVDYVMIPGSGHSMHRDSYEPFWAALVGWMTGVAGND